MKKTSEVGNARLEIFTAVKNQVVVLWIMTPCSDVGTSIFRLKIEEARSSETLVSYHITTWFQNPKFTTQR
jgi:hypothetical protein